uniref:hypothetical protein n=1 Tax=Staphylococcus aureus TaxID=1280 RepID=UPI00301C8A76
MAEHVLTLVGEVRRAVGEGGRLVAMDVRRAGDGVWPGEVWRGRQLRAGWASVDGQEVRFPGGPKLAEGAALAVEVTRAAIPERG